MKFGDYPKVGSFGNVGEFRHHLRTLGLDMPCDEIVSSGPGAPLAAPLEVLSRRIDNRFATQPMEGWDALEDGRPSERTRRRWRRFGTSGAKLIWGGEAVAVRRDGRANPNQLYFAEHTQGEIAALREALVASHKETMGSDGGLVIGLQLTHSGRFSRPEGEPSPTILYHHPILDRRFNLAAEVRPMSDDEIARLIEDFIASAVRARECGFDFVDIKHCHGYLGHEFLSATSRPGHYGGSLENRTRFLRDIVSGIRAAAPELGIAVRVSAFDLVPFMPDPERSSGPTLGPGVPEDFSSCIPYRCAFGANAEKPDEIDLAEAKDLFRILLDLGIKLVNVTAGSPYYNPHVTRPALYPPSDGYLPPEDPLVGVMRQLEATRQLKRACPEITVVGSGYTYLQEYLPNVAQAAVRQGWTDFVGLGRMLLAYPELPRDVLSGKGLQKKRLCRSFSDCTTAPRNGLVSGCYPLDTEYKKSPEAKALAAVKKAAKLA